MSNSFDFKLFSASSEKQQAEEEKKLPTEVNCQAKFNFEAQQIFLCFSDDEWDWTLYSLVAKYKSIDGDVVIFDQSEIGAPPGQSYQKFAQVYKLGIDKIDRNVMYKQFSVTIVYAFLDDPDKQLYATEYEFDVSFNFVNNLCY